MRQPADRLIEGGDLAARAVDIGVVADAIAESGRVRFAYLDQHGRASTRLIEPHRHVLRGGQWYLVASDVDRDDWRLFRFDRVADLERVPGVYSYREFPADSVQDWFASDFGRSSCPDRRVAPSIRWQYGEPG